MKYYVEWYLPYSTEAVDRDELLSFDAALFWLDKHLSAGETRIGRFHATEPLTPGQAAALAPYNLENWPPRPLTSRHG